MMFIMFLTIKKSGFSRFTNEKYLLIYLFIRKEKIMRNIWLFSAFGIFQCIFLCGQSNAGKLTIQASAVVDTIPKNAVIILDPSVVSCYATYVTRGICITRKITGNVVSYGDFLLESGNILIIEEIISVNKEGKQIKLPVRKYVIQ